MSVEIVIRRNTNTAEQKELVRGRENDFTISFSFLLLLFENVATVIVILSHSDTRFDRKHLKESKQTLFFLITCA